MAFESLSDKLQKIMKKVKGQAKLTESNMDDMLREIRIALLEADVNYKVVKEFINNVKEKAIGQKVLTKLSPGQMLVKIVRDEITELLGSGNTEITFEMSKPTIIMLVGLQGTGKTTSAAKMARLFQKKYAKKVVMAACDIYRPAAIDQLETLGQKIGVEVYADRTGTKPPQIAEAAYRKVLSEKADVLIIDTAGRLQIDDTLMTELEDIIKIVPVTETILLVDAMSGQDAVNVAKTFDSKIKLTGLIMSKLDGDSRGGSALSIKHLTNVPIKFAGVGEKIDDLEVFYPERMADRILGMGDVVSLIEKAQENIDEDQAKKTVKKMMSGNFDLDDMVQLMKTIKKMGRFSGLLKMVPGMPKISDEDAGKVEDILGKTEVIIQSMTKEERKHPEILKNSRKVRIAKGSGTTAADINKIVGRFDEMKKQMAMLKKYNNNFPQ